MKQIHKVLKNRDETLVKIRPIIDVEVFSETIETFQNQTLRPILKLQNDLIFLIFKNQIKKRKSNFRIMNLNEKHTIIHRFLKEDNHFKAIYLGVIIGHFTILESEFYFQNENEVAKRIFSMLIERIKSQIE